MLLSSQSASTVPGSNDCEFTQKLLLLLIFLKIRQYFCQMHPWQCLQRGRTCHSKTPNQKLLHQILTALGAGFKKIPVYAWSINKDLVLSTLLGYATEVESLIGITFFFDVLNDSYLQMEKMMSQPPAFIAYEGGHIMYYHQVINLLDAWTFTHALVKEVNGHNDNGGCSWFHASDQIQSPFKFVWQ